MSENSGEAVKDYPLSPPVDKATARKLLEAEIWVLDLDNTLYPAQCNLFAQVDVRIRDYISIHYDLHPDEAFKLQKHYFREYGTTLKGLMEEHGQDPHHYLDYVHDIDMSPVKKDTRLEEHLSRLPGKKVVFTNADRDYAGRVMERIGIDHHMTDIFDIIAADFLPKPEPSIYDTLLERLDAPAEKMVMVEDIARNLGPAAERGMSTVWIKHGDKFAPPPGSDIRIDYTIDNLTDWLGRVAEHLD